MKKFCTILLAISIFGTIITFAILMINLANNNKDNILLFVRIFISFIGLTAVSAWFSIFNYKCPCCGAHQFYAYSKFCRKCGAPLR